MGDVDHLLCAGGFAACGQQTGIGQALHYGLHFTDVRGVGSQFIQPGTASRVNGAFAWLHQA